MKRFRLLMLIASVVALSLAGCIPPLANEPIDVSLPSSSAMDGDITSGGVVSTAKETFCVGDYDTNVATRGFLSFDLTSILSKGSVKITRAVLKASMMNWAGYPIAELGNVNVYSVDYSTSLNAIDYAVAGTLIGPIADSTGIAREYDIDVTAAVSGVVDRKGSYAQFRFQPADQDTNNDSTRNSSSWATNEDSHYAPVLEITYIKQ